MTESKWTNFWAEMRHSPCLMRPVSLVMFVTMILFWLITLCLNIPNVMLGFLLSPILSRGSWLIEFLYPLGVARWGHLLLIRLSRGKSNHADKAANYHSRTMEQRIEVVLGRVFVHPMPQLLDNLGYLVVCLPPPKDIRTSGLGTSMGNTVSVETQQEDDAPIVAFLVDCGDATAVQEQVELIRGAHYNDQEIHIQMILSTHKHHDHTAGNAPFRTLDKIGSYLKLIVGGAVERVPGCNYPVADGELLPLPKHGCNDMNDVVQVETIAVPAHTRGSIVYALRPKQLGGEEDESELPAPCFVFTGDTMFSGGGGVPFEAGSQSDVDKGQYGDDPHGAVRAGVGAHAVERCFAEILVRSMPMKTASFVNATGNFALDEYLSLMSDQFLVFPGHEYTTELLSRQFGASGGALTDATKWKNFSPHVFFETVSQFYVAIHRRSLPQATGRLIAAAPTTLRRELAINPHLRSLTKRAEIVLQAIRMWHHYFSKPKSPLDEEAAIRQAHQQHDLAPFSPRTSNTQAFRSTLTRKRKTPSTSQSWTMDTVDAAQSIFTTVYTSDLDAIIEDLHSGGIGPESAVLRLDSLKFKLSEPVVRRRPIPGTLPSEKNTFKGILGLALLGSKPSAMTLSDSQTMKLPPPVITDSSALLISKKRLIIVLGRLRLLGLEDGQRLVSMIEDLWEEAAEYADLESKASGKTKPATPKWLAEDTSDASVERDNNTADDSNNNTHDYVELGALKWVLYGFPASQPSWFSRYCMPCGSSSPRQTQFEHPSEGSGMKRQHGELVRHDIMACKLCRMAAGQPPTEDEHTVVVDSGFEPSAIIQHKNSATNLSVDSASTRPDETAVGDDDESCVEVSHISSILPRDIPVKSE